MIWVVIWLGVVTVLVALVTYYEGMHNSASLEGLKDHERRLRELENHINESNLSVGDRAMREERRKSKQL